MPHFLIYPYGVMNEKIPVITLLQKASRGDKKACTGTALSWKDTWSPNKDDTNHQSEIQQTVWPTKINKITNVKEARWKSAIKLFKHKIQT